MDVVLLEEYQQILSTKICQHLPNSRTPTFGSWYVWAYIAVTASSARLPAITFFVIINKY